MMSFLNPLLAQAAAVPEEVTVGTVITAMMFLMTAVGSLAMIIAWVIRFGQTGHALPAARRGVLRVPWPLTAVAVALSVLLMALVLTSSFVDPVPVANNVVAATPAEVKVDAAGPKAAAEGQQALPATEPKTTEAASPDAEVTDSSAVPASDSKNAVGGDTESSKKKKSIDPGQMKNAVIQTIVMDIVMLLAFGTVVLVASNAGRVYLQDSLVSQSPKSGSRALISQQSGRPFGAGMGFGSPWPDLDDAASIPQMPGYDILGNRGLNDPGRVPSGTTEDADASPNVPVSPAAQQPETSAYNPFAVVLEDEPFGTDPNAAAPVAAAPQIADEPFSLARELRFAAEVFLAAYLPTTALRLLIVLISMSIVGEPPASHPFLEMLEAGVSVPMILMILVMAVFVAPIVEELQFRVVILGGIAQLGKPMLALIASSILFSFAHGFPDSIALIPLALALGYTYLRRRSYVTVMLVHFLFNGFNMILALVALL